MGAKTWTTERITLAADLYKAGSSASQIAAQLGGVTRNAVIGLLHRHKIARDPSRARAGKQSGALQRRMNAGPVKPRPPRLQPKLVAAMESPRTEPLNIRLVDLKREPVQCRWPTIYDTEQRFCGLPTNGEVYCAWCIAEHKPFVAPKPHRPGAAFKSRGPNKAWAA